MSSPGARLRDAWADRPIMIPGAFNALTARIAERLGFERTGVLREVGTKFGEWLDLAFLQLVLSPGE